MIQMILLGFSTAVISLRFSECFHSYEHYYCSLTEYEYDSHEHILDSTEETPLRHVEKDVLIPKMMREKAKERCVQHVDGTTGLY